MNDLDDLVFYGVGLASFKSLANALLLYYPYLLSLSLYIPLFSPLLTSVSLVCGVGFYGLEKRLHSLLALHRRLF